jgi:hypothetical protein
LPDVAAALARRLADIVGSCANAASLNSSEYLPSDYLPLRGTLRQGLCRAHPKHPNILAQDASNRAIMTGF